MAPDREWLVTFLNATSVQLSLRSWRSGGCPITGFNIKYKERQEIVWTAITSSEDKDLEDPDRDLDVVLIDGLRPQTWYVIQVTAASEAGSSEAEYSILTPAFRDPSKSTLRP